MQLEDSVQNALMNMTNLKGISLVDNNYDEIASQEIISNANICINAKYSTDYLLINFITKMLRENKMTFKTTDLITKEDINFLNGLVFKESIEIKFK